MNKSTNQQMISDYEKFPIHFNHEENELFDDFVLEGHPRMEQSSDRFVNNDDLFFIDDADNKANLTQSWSDISLDSENHNLKSEILNLEQELGEELEMKFNITDEVRNIPRQNLNLGTVIKKGTYKYQNFEAITARLDYEDLEVLRSLKSKIKVLRQQYVKPDGVRRERITENMIIRSLVKCFANHSLESQSFKWGMVNTEEDLYKQISRAFKGIR